MIPVEQWKVKSDSRPEGWGYIVSKMDDGSWACGCVGWTRHVPRRDCKHIAYAKNGFGIPVDLMIHAMEKAQRKVAA